MMRATYRGLSRFVMYPRAPFANQASGLFFLFFIRLTCNCFRYIARGTFLTFSLALFTLVDFN